MPGVNWEKLVEDGKVLQNILKSVIHYLKAVAIEQTIIFGFANPNKGKQFALVLESSTLRE